LISYRHTVYSFLLPGNHQIALKKQLWLYSGGIMRIKRLLILMPVLCTLMSFSAVLAWGLDMSEGDWEVTMTTTMQGMPYQMPPMTYKSTQCTTKDDLAPQNKNNKNCEIKDQSVVGNVYSWRVVCADKDGRTDGTGQITYRGSSYNGTMNMKVTDKKGAVMTMLTKLSGRYLGACSAATKAEADRRRAASKK
jgi:hypothetical protein